MRFRTFFITSEPFNGKILFLLNFASVWFSKFVLSKDHFWYQHYGSHQLVVSDFPRTTPIFCNSLTVSTHIPSAMVWILRFAFNKYPFHTVTSCNFHIKLLIIIDFQFKVQIDSFPSAEIHRGRKINEGICII